MNSYSVLFNKTPEQLRRVGARGGKARARNRRTRLAAAARSVLVPSPALHAADETVAQAIAALDAQFPWLRNAEKRQPPRSA